MKSIISALLVAIAIVGLGLAIRSGLRSFTENSRTVDVRGLAEREVAANHVTWPIVYKLTGNDLPAVYRNINTTNETIVKFLTDNGLSTGEISVSAPKMEDNIDNYNYKPGITARYAITSIITVSSDQVDKVRGLILRQGDLLSMGIPVQAQEYSNSVNYEFTDLNSIKPEMIAEATRNAREAAKKFADDSGSEIGKIKNARQGQFTIENRDQYTPYIKTVRVVTSLTYFLDN